MLTQIYEMTSAREAGALCAIGVDHVVCWWETAAFRASSQCLARPR